MTEYTDVESKLVFDDNDIHSAALCAWKEARGEGNEGMVGVLCVLRNRVDKPGFAQTLHNVVFGKNQFTSMSVPSDPEFNLEPVENDEYFDYAFAEAKIIFGGTHDDPTNGSLYYANLHEIGQTGWFYRNIVLKSDKHPIRAQINHHTFFA